MSHYNHRQKNSKVVPIFIKLNFLFLFFTEHWRHFMFVFSSPPPPTSSCFSHHTKHSVRVAAAWAPMLYKSSPSLLLLPTAKTKKLVCMLSTCSYTPGQFISVQIKTTCAKKIFLKANMCSLPYVKISSYCFQKNCSICLIGDIMLSWERHWHYVVTRKVTDIMLPWERHWHIIMRSLILCCHEKVTDIMLSWESE